MRKYLIFIISAVFLSSLADAQIMCSANFETLSPGAIFNIEIYDESQPLVAGNLELNGAFQQFEKVTKKDYVVRKDIDISKPSVYLKLNSGERRVSLLMQYLNDPDLKRFLDPKLPYDLRSVKFVRIYDINNDADDVLSGGNPLVEFRDANKKVLGRFFQSKAIRPCIAKSK